MSSSIRLRGDNVSRQVAEKKPKVDDEHSGSEEEAKPKKQRKVGPATVIMLLADRVEIRLNGAVFQSKAKKEATSDAEEAEEAPRRTGRVSDPIPCPGGSFTIAQYRECLIGVEEEGSHHR
jgi:hypothetical protein